MASIEGQRDDKKRKFVSPYFRWAKMQSAFRMRRNIRKLTQLSRG
jgi:hypothetical protein